MLVSLHIENVAVIRCVDVDLSSGLCVLTGETGAGKSLLIDSINFLTGGRVSREIIRTGEEKAMVSAVFTPDEETRKALTELGIDIEDGLMLQRVVRRDGRSDARINGRAVTGGLLREVGNLLINIHGQSDNQKLMQTATHRSLLDAYAGDGEALSTYVAVYTQWKQTRTTLAGLRQDVSERLRLREMLEYQIKDIDSAKLRPGEEEKLIERRDRLLYQEKINRQARLAARALTDSEKATVIGLIDRAEGAIEQLSAIIPESEELISRLNAMRAEAEDISERVRGFCDEDLADPTAELDKLEGRLDTISRLGRKYGATITEILDFRDKAAARLSEIDTADERIEVLEAEEKALAAELKKLSRDLTKCRQAAAESLSGEVQEALTFLDMPKVTFRVSVTPAASYTADGGDDIEFLISTNPGDPPAPMVRIASGGELSRIMLAVRSVLNQRYGIPTTIYDEVDTGISGRTARKVGIKLAGLSEHAQVICVTHSAQIASLADAHYVIEKRELPSADGTGRAETSVRLLPEAARVEEIARILGGLDVTDTQRAAARELMAERHKY